MSSLWAGLNMIFMRRIFRIFRGDGVIIEIISDNFNTYRNHLGGGDMSEFLNKLQIFRHISISSSVGILLSAMLIKYEVDLSIDRERVLIGILLYLSLMFMLTGLPNYLGILGRGLVKELHKIKTSYEQPYQGQIRQDYLLIRWKQEIINQVSTQLSYMSIIAILGIILVMVCLYWPNVAIVGIIGSLFTSAALTYMRVIKRMRVLYRKN